MSFRHVQAAGLLPIKDATVKAVLACLAHHANEFTCRCWPSLERIELFTGLARRTVQMAIQRIEGLKLIEVKRGANRMTSCYLLTLPTCPPISQTHSASDDKAGAAFDENADAHGADEGGHGASDDVHSAGDAPQESMKVIEERRETRASVAIVSKSVLPADWWPAAERFTQAEKDYADVDVRGETEQFVSYNRGKGTEIHDRDAAWWSWLKRARQLAERDRRNGPRRRGHREDPASLDFLRSGGPAVRAPEPRTAGLLGAPDPAARS